MITVTDGQKVREDLCSANTLTFLLEVAKRNNRPVLVRFLEDGITTDLVGLLDDIEKVDWPGVEGVDIVAELLEELIERCNDVVYISV